MRLRALVDGLLGKAASGLSEAVNWVEYYPSLLSGMQARDKPMSQWELHEVYMTVEPSGEADGSYEVWGSCKYYGDLNRFFRKKGMKTLDAAHGVVSEQVYQASIVFQGTAFYLFSREKLPDGRMVHLKEWDRNKRCWSINPDHLF